MVSSKKCTEQKISYRVSHNIVSTFVVKLQVLDLRLGVDFTFTLDNNDNNPHLNFFKGKVLGVKEQGLGIRDKCQGSRDKT